MKTKKIKMFVVLACMTFGLSPIAMGQIYSSEYLYYHSDQDDKMVIIKFEGSTATQRIESSGYTFFVNESSVRRRLKQDSRWFERDYNSPEGRGENKYEYCSEESSYEWTVYKHTYETSDLEHPYFDGFTWVAPKSTHYYYLAISRDKKRMKCWSKSDSKTNYSQVNKDFYLPKDEFYNE